LKVGQKLKLKTAMDLHTLGKLPEGTEFIVVTVDSLGMVLGVGEVGNTATLEWTRPNWQDYFEKVRK